LTLDTNTLDGKIFGTNDDDHLKLIFLYAYGATSAVNVGDTVAETFRGSGYIDIAQIKLESGDKATPFVPRFYAKELVLCKRYFRKLTVRGIATTTMTLNSMSRFEIAMRIAPTPTKLVAAICNSRNSLFR